MLRITRDSLINLRSIVVDGIGPCSEDVLNEKEDLEKFVEYWEKRCEKTIPNGEYYMVLIHQ